MFQFYEEKDVIIAENVFVKLNKGEVPFFLTENALDIIIFFCVICMLLKKVDL